MFHKPKTQKPTNSLSPRLLCIDTQFPPFPILPPTHATYQALHRIERARAACRCEKPSRYTLYNHGHARADNEFHKQHSSSQHRQQHQQHGDAAIAQHVLSKERPLEWFLEPSAGGKGEEDDELTAAAADSLECMSLHPSGPSSSSRSSATASDDDLLAAACWDDDENFVTPPQELYEAQQREEQEDPQQAASAAHMYKEYSFRDIFEYALGGRASQGSRASNLNLASSLDSAASAGGKGGSGGGSSKGSKMSLSSTAAARAVAAVVLKAGQPKRNSGAANAAPCRSAVAAKCRAAPESSPGAASYAPAQTHTYSTSWRSVGGYMAQRAAASVAGLSGASASVASHGHGHQQGGGDDGWGLYVDLDIVG